MEPQSLKEFGFFLIFGKHVSEMYRCRLKGYLIINKYIRDVFIYIYHIYIYSYMYHIHLYIVCIVL